MKIYGVLLVFYPDYIQGLITHFESILKKISSDYELVIVCNSSELLNSDDRAIKGSNEFWEFSGWKVGIDYLTDKYNIKEDDTFVFANDTFYKHRYFGCYDQYLFRKAILKQSYLKKDYIVGELCAPIGSFNIENLTGSGWISTYLFSMPYRTVDKCSPFHYENKQLDYYIVNNRSEFHLNPKAVSNNLVKYMKAWLYPKYSDTGAWRNRHSNDTIKYYKLKAILNEKRLSLMCTSFGGELVDIYHNNRFYKKIKNSLSYRYRLLINYLFNKGMKGES
jgi:hypothetical protein